MADKINPLPSMSRVVPGSTATLDLKLGPTYKRVFFECTGTALLASHIGKIRVLIDGKEVHVYKNLQRLIDMNAYYKRGADTVNQFCLHFDRAEMHSLAARRAPGFGTADVQTFNIEIELSAGAPANITMKAYAHVDTDPAPLGLIFKVREIPFSSAVAGVVEVDKLVRGPWYAAMHCFKSDITNIEVIVNNTVVVDAPKSILERMQKEASPVQRVPMTSQATSVDLVTEGDMFRAFVTGSLKDFRLKLTLATAGAVDIVTETLDTLQGA